MIVKRLLWPLLHTRFGVPAAPAWFQRRVRRQLLDQSRNMPDRRVAILASLCIAPMADLFGHYVLMDRYHVAQNAMTVGVICALLPVGWGITLVWLEVREACVLLKSGSLAMSRAVEAVRAQMTAHERIECAAFVQGRQSWRVFLPKKT